MVANCESTYDKSKTVESLYISNKNENVWLGFHLSHLKRIKINEKHSYNMQITIKKSCQKKISDSFVHFCFNKNQFL